MFENWCGDGWLRWRYRGGVGVGGRCGPMGNAAAGAQIQFLGKGIIMNAGKREELDTADSKLRIPKSKFNL